MAEWRLFDLSRTLDNWQRWLSRHPDRPRRTGQVHHATTIVVSDAQAEAGLGLATGHEVPTQGLIAEGLLMRPFDFSVPMTERCFLITPPEKWVNAAGRAFCDWLRA